MGLNSVQGAAIPVPWNFIEVQGAGAEPQVRLTVAVDVLSDAPTVDVAQWPAQAGAEWDLEIQNYWSAIPAAQ